MSVEEPLSILALENICATVESNLRQMRGHNSAVHPTVTKPLQPADELIGYGVANGAPQSEAAARKVTQSLEAARSRT